MRQAAVSYRTDRAHCLCYYKLQPQEAILHKTKGKPLRTPLVLLDVARCQISLSRICRGSGLPQCPQITETHANKEVLE